jgi:hypothetical protein
VEGYLDLVSRPPAAGDAPVTPLLARLRVELKGVNPDAGAYVLDALLDRPPQGRSAGPKGPKLRG